MQSPLNLAQVRICTLVLALATAGLAILVPVNSAQGATPGVIDSNGPLSTIKTTPDLNCDVRHVSDTSSEFFGETACGTLVAAGGELWGPEEIPAGESAAPRTPFTPVSQIGPTGLGTAADPFKVVTVVDAGSELRLTQIDTYVVGESSYQTTVRVQNIGSDAVSAIIYRAGDCYLDNSDEGLGEISDDSVACKSPGNRVEKWIPITPGSKHYEAYYDQVWSVIGSQQPFDNSCRCEENIDNGAGLSWTLNINAGQTSAVTHRTAFSPTEVETDQDGDGLLDTWETSGIDVNGDGQIEIDLPAMGARADHKDLFVEADWMVKPSTCVGIICWGGRNFKPNLASLRDAATAMADSPVANPDGTTGINLHVDAGPNSLMNPENNETWGSRSRANNVGHVRDLGSMSGSGNYSWGAFNQLKANNFEHVRADVFHYTIFADRYAQSGSSGIAQVGDPFEGDSFLVTDGDADWGPTGFSQRQESGTFMHEFGHTLGLRHGGGDDVNYKPNYLSIMSYDWQLDGRRPLDYSRSALGALDETSLIEGNGLSGATGMFAWSCPSDSIRMSSVAAQVDWDCNGSINGGAIAADINGDDSHTTLHGFDDWSNLVYDGGAVGAFGAQDTHDEDPPLVESVADEPSAANLVKTPGDGSVGITGPTMLLKGVAGQTVQVSVTNVSDDAASYTLRASGIPAVAAQADVGVLQPHSTVEVELPVDGSLLTLGTKTLHVDLVRDAQTLDSAELAVTVPNLDDQVVVKDLWSALDQLKSPQPGLPDSQREALVQRLSAVLPPIVTPTNNPPAAVVPPQSTLFFPPSVGTPVGKTGSLSVLVPLPGAGTLTVNPVPVKVKKKFVTYTKPMVVSVAGPGSAQVTLVPTKPANKILKKRAKGKKIGRLPVRVTMTFTTVGGMSSTKTVVYTLIRP